MEGHPNRLTSRFLLGVSSTTLATLIPQLVSFVGIMLILRWVDPDAFGVYALLVTLAQFFSTISELGLGTSVIRHIQTAIDESERRAMVLSTFTATVLLSLAAGALAILAQPLILRLYNYPLLAQVLWYMPFLLLVNNTNNIIIRVLQAVFAYRLVLVLSILIAVIRFAFVIVLVKFAGQGVRGIIFADLAAGAVTLVVALMTLPVRIRLQLDRDVLRRLMRFGFPLYVNGLLSYLFLRIDVLMIGGMTNTQYVAAVDVAKRVPSNLNMLLISSFMTVFFPNVSALLARDEKDRAIRLVATSLRVTAYATAAVAVIIFMLQDEIVGALFSSEYLFVGTAFSIFMLVQALGMASTIMGTTLVAAGHPQAAVRVNVFVVATNIIGNLLLIPIWGFVGAAVANLAATIVSLPMNQAYLHRRVMVVNALDYIGPIALAAVFWAARRLLDIDSLALRLLLIAVYPLLCLILFGSLRRDVRQLWAQSRALLHAAWRRRGDASGENPVLR